MKIIISIIRNNIAFILLMYMILSICNQQKIYCEQGTDRLITMQHKKDRFIDTTNCENANTITRNYIYINFGAPEIFGIGYGIDLFNNWSVAAKFCYFIVSGGVLLPNYSYGYGIKLSKLFNEPLFKHSYFLKIDNISFEFALNKDSKQFQTLVGREHILDNGLNFLWGIGVGLTHKKDELLIVSPYFKIGFTFNF